ncbi:indole-3-glycerol phosphate synthase TrpC [Microbacteriaceae bacterium 4G12]
MATILQTILEQKKKEVDLLRKSGFRCEERKQHPSFVKKLAEPNITVISEIKRASPSKGDLCVDIDVKQRARQYEILGAGMISVLTDEIFFKGSFVDVEQVRSVTSIPILCKDFIIDEVQIQRANASGADVILLIVAALTPDRLRTLYTYAKELGVEAIIEVHNEQELDIALSIQPEIIGVNNRDLKTFTVNIETTERLARRVLASGALLISESGIQTREDVLRVQRAGASGILVGEAFMVTDSLEQVFEALGNV